MPAKVSVCIPTYNRSSSLRNTIQLILAQEYKDIEVIVGDDASTDDTLNVIKELNLPTIKYYKNDINIGIYPNWNKLLSIATGEYICIYHDHDVYLPTILAKSLSLFENNPNVSFVHTAFLLIDKFKCPQKLFIMGYRPVTSGKQMHELLLGSLTSSLCAATVMVRRTAYEKVGNYSAAYGLGSDKEMWLRLSRIGDVGYVSAVQACILGRTKGDTTDRFDIEDYLGQVRLLTSANKDFYGEYGEESKRNLIKISRELKKILTIAVVKAVLFEDDHTAKERYFAVAPHVGRFQKQFLYLLVTAHPVSKLFLRFFIKPFYRGKVYKCRKAAIDYCLNNGAVNNYLNLEVKAHG